MDSKYVFTTKIVHLRVRYFSFCLFLLHLSLVGCEEFILRLVTRLMSMVGGNSNSLANTKWSSWVTYKGCSSHSSALVHDPKLVVWRLGGPSLNWKNWWFKVWTMRSWTKITDRKGDKYMVEFEMSSHLGLTWDLWWAQINFTTSIYLTGGYLANPQCERDRRWPAFRALMVWPGAVRFFLFSSLLFLQSFLRVCQLLIERVSEWGSVSLLWWVRYPSFSLYWSNQSTKRNSVGVRLYLRILQV